MLEPTQRKFSPEEHAQLAALQQRQAGRELDAAFAASDIRLRQWCVEQAIAVYPHVVKEGFLVSGVAVDIHDFVTAPLKPEVPK